MNGRRVGASPRELEAFGRIEQLNITVAMPVMLWLLVQPLDRLDPGEREFAIRAIESFVLRRMAAKYQTRAYGQVFVEVLKTAQGAAANPGRAVIKALRGKPHGYEWPTLDDLVEAFETARYYNPGGINQDRLRMLLGAVDRLLQNEATKSETITIDYDTLQIEHVIPVAGETNGPFGSMTPTLASPPSNAGNSTSTASGT